MNYFLSTGIIGFTIVLVANFVALFGLGMSNALFFSGAWYSTWFSNYVLWFVFTIIGAAYNSYKGTSDRDH
jgi:hypothetical protein